MPFYNFYPEVDINKNDKNIVHHPWEKYIKDPYISTYKYGHNTAKNPIVYPPPKKGKVPCADRMKFTVIGTSIAKEFIYCMKLVQGLHKYRWSNFDAPIIKAVTNLEWPLVWNDLKIRYGGEAYCLENQVAVILNDEFLGGKRELKELITSKYSYYLKPDYYAEGVKRFTNYLNASRRPHACLEFMIDNKEIGPMIFMLYTDLVPRTCENFLRLCKQKKGGYSGTPVHRIVKDSWIQCGGFGLKDTGLDCENFIVPHDRRGVIGMCNDGRHVDGSTQFFILLQPQDWMAYKYVAFGQLISGDQVLKQIEQVPAWYESPVQNIIISKSSILNFECQDIRIHKGTYKYLLGHTENLLEIGAIFYEELIEKVFLEAEFRSLQRIQDEMIQLGTEAYELTSEEVANNLRTAERFMRKKEEIEKQIQEKSQGGDRSGKTTPAVTVVVDKGENNDFDVEEYEYVPEHYSYAPASFVVASSSETVKPEKPFLIPLTDVPYPGEVSSEYDLKRLLQGHYCLESDIDPELGKKKKKVVLDRLKNYPERVKELFKPPVSEEESETSLDSHDEREIAAYLRDHTDRVSFAGDVIKTLARTDKYVNVFDPQNISELIPDEALRRLRLAEEEFRREHETVTMGVTKSHQMRKDKLRRKQTGFMRPEDLARMRQLDEELEEDDDDAADGGQDDFQPFYRQSSDQLTLTRVKKESIVPQEAKRSDEQLDDDEEEMEEKRKLEESKFETLRRTHFVRKDVMISIDDEVAIEKRDSYIDDDTYFPPEVLKRGYVDQLRSSGLTRLFDEITEDDQEQGPTLKNFVPIAERQRTNSLQLLTFSVAINKRNNLEVSSKMSRELYLKRRHSVDMPDTQPIDDVLLLQHGPTVSRKMSTDYVKTIDRIEQKEQTSIRSLEYAKFRPGISVADYQKKNAEYRQTQLQLKLSKDNAARKSRIRVDKHPEKHPEKHSDRQDKRASIYVGRTGRPSTLK